MAVTDAQKDHSLEARPVVGPHLQKPADDHAEPDATAVAQQDVQDNLVPPALGEVGQQMHEEQLRDTTDGGCKKRSMSF